LWLHKDELGAYLVFKNLNGKKAYSPAPPKKMIVDRVKFPLEEEKTKLLTEN
jgi:hypothetical protein